MKLEKNIVIIYTFLGLIAGILSNYINPFEFAILVSVVIYLIPTIFLIKRVKSKRIKWLISNSLVTFLLVWFVVWIFLNNIK
jgi:hypothetical protein